MKYHAPDSYNSVVVAVKFEGRNKILTVAMLLVRILENKITYKRMSVTSKIFFTSYHLRTLYEVSLAQLPSQNFELFFFFFF